MSKYCGHNAFEKASLIVKEEMKSLFQCLASLSRKFFYSQRERKGLNHKSLGIEFEGHTLKNSVVDSFKFQIILVI